MPCYEPNDNSQLLDILQQEREGVDAITQYQRKYSPYLQAIDLKGDNVQKLFVYTDWLTAALCLLTKQSNFNLNNISDVDVKQSGITKYALHRWIDAHYFMDYCKQAAEQIGQKIFNKT